MQGKYRVKAEATFKAYNLDDALLQLSDHLNCVRLMVPDASPLEFKGDIRVDIDEDEDDDNT